MAYYRTENGATAIASIHVGTRLRRPVLRPHPPTERERLKQQDLAKTRLSESGYPALRRLTCEVSDGVIVLSGKVSCYYMKQMAQTLVRDVPGIGVLVNNLEVVRDSNT